MAKKSNLPVKPEHLSVDLPRIDGDTQSRVAINEDTVADYAEVISNSDGDWPFPSLDVFHDGTDYYVADGFHRFLAAQRSKRGTFPCRIHKGTAKDARIFGMTANDTHGLRMTRADKRACVEWLLDCGDKMTQVAISKAAGVSVRTVRTIVTDRKYEATPKSPPEVGRQTSATPSGGGSVEPIDVDSEPEPVASATCAPSTCPLCHTDDLFPDGSCRACIPDGDPGVGVSPTQKPEWPDDPKIIDTPSEPVQEPPGLHHRLPSLPGDERSTAGYMRDHHKIPSQGVQDGLKAAQEAFADKEPEAAESAGTWLRDNMGPIILECKRKFPDVPAFLAAGVVETLTADWRK